MGIRADRDYLECSCGLANHTLRFSRTHGMDDYDKLLVIDMYLGHYRGFWKHLWYGIKYAFGYKCPYGAFDEVLLEPDQVAKLKDLCDRHLKAVKEQEVPLTEKDKKVLDKMIMEEVRKR